MHETTLDQILNEIRSIKPVSLIEGRRPVWDNLAEMYASAQNDIRIWGQGADLSHLSTRKDISRLTEQTKTILGDRKIITRIQTVDTWSSWLDWQTKLIGDHPETYLLYFTDQQLNFVPQLNIKDKDEVSLVTPEQQRQLTYSIRIRKSGSRGGQAIQKHINNFDNLLRERSSQLVNPTYLSLFAKTLSNVKEWQMLCFLSGEFHSQKKRGFEKFKKPEYISIQRHFTLDHKDFRKFAWDTLNQHYSAYRQSQYPSLGSVLSILTSDKRLDVDELTKQIISQIWAEGHSLKSKEIAAFLHEDEEDIESTSYRLIRYLSRSLFRILEEISSVRI